MTTLRRPHDPWQDERENPPKSAVRPAFCRSACPLWTENGCPVGKASGHTALCAHTVANLRRHNAMRESF
ncbi:hypothetical protein dsx2_2602 [Desulfovibrio sp. X2]|nr:hypothetical protein dsx2_2602 [Desulfovibrio sp. X2]